MKANEFRVGNYFDLYGSIAKLHPTDFKKWCKDFEFEDFRPLLLTDQRLLQLGFEYYEPLNHYRIVINDIWYSVIKLNHNSFEGFWFTFVNLNWDETKEMPYKKVEYVHQIQNLFFALASEELILKT